MYHNAETTPLVQYGYDYRGNRLFEGTPTSKTWYQIDTNNLTGYSQVVNEIDQTSTIQKTYSYGFDLNHVINNPGQPGSKAYYYHYDGLGSTRALTNSTGVLQNRYSYTAFGITNSSLTSEPIPPGESSNFTQPYRFTGERYDDLTGLYHLRARQYDPTIGRFTTFDPAEDMNNKLHKYNYCHNDPTNCLDLTGKGFLELPTIGAIVMTLVMTALVIVSFALFVKATVSEGRKVYERRYNEIADPNSQLAQYCHHAAKYFHVSALHIGAIISAEAEENLRRMKFSDNMWDKIFAGIEPITDATLIDTSAGVTQLKLNEVRNLKEKYNVEFRRFVTINPEFEHTSLDRLVLADKSNIFFYAAKMHMLVSENSDYRDENGSLKSPNEWPVDEVNLWRFAEASDTYKWDMSISDVNFRTGNPSNAFKLNYDGFRGRFPLNFERIKNAWGM